MLTRRRVALAVVAVLVLVTAWQTGPALLRRLDPTPLDQALAVLSSDAERVVFTDWRQVREATGIAATDQPNRSTVEKLLQRGYDSDLTGASAIEQSTGALQRTFGFSPLTVDWEVFAQSQTGAVLVVKLPDDDAASTVQQRLRKVGYTKPGTATGVWRGGIDLVAATDPELTPIVQYIAVLADRGLVVASDDEEQARAAARAALGRTETLADVDSATDLAGSVEEPAAAELWVRDRACVDLGPDPDDPDTAAEMDAVVERAGKITPLSGFLLTLDADRTLRGVLRFESGRQAEENLKARAALAIGPAVGRGGDFADTLRLEEAAADGPLITLRWKPRQSSGFVISALDSGPVVFARC